MGSIEAPSNLTYGTFRYITKGIKPTESKHLYHLPETSEFGDVRSLPMTDIRSSLDLASDSPYKLNKQGFTARRHSTALKSPPYTHSSWNNEALLKEIYIPEIEALLLQVTGGKTAFTDSVVMRNNIHTEVDGLAREESTGEVSEFPKFVGTKFGAGGSPAPKVHLDYAPSGAKTHIRRYHARVTELCSEIIEAEDRLLAKGVSPAELKDYYDGPRWAMFSVWRPLKTVRRDPIALSDCRTFPKDDYVDFNVLFPSAGGGESHKEEVFLAYGSEGHAWHWISNQQPDEVLIIQLFDSEAEKSGLGVAGGVMHSSVHIDGTEYEEARESVEVRCTVIW
ncbi:GA4 desaturase [Hyaloscypha variabilis]